MHHVIQQLEQVQRQLMQIGRDCSAAHDLVSGVIGQLQQNQAAAPYGAAGRGQVAPGPVAGAPIATRTGTAPPYSYPRPLSGSSPYTLAYGRQGYGQQPGQTANHVPTSTYYTPHNSAPPATGTSVISAAHPGAHGSVGSSPVSTGDHVREAGLIGRQSETSTYGRTTQ